MEMLNTQILEPEQSLQDAFLNRFTSMKHQAKPITCSPLQIIIDRIDKNRFPVVPAKQANISVSTRLHPHKRHIGTSGAARNFEAWLVSSCRKPVNRNERWRSCLGTQSSLKFWSRRLQFTYQIRQPVGESSNTNRSNLTTNSNWLVQQRTFVQITDSVTDGFRFPQCLIC